MATKLFSFCRQGDHLSSSRPQCSFKLQLAAKLQMCLFLSDFLPFTVYVCDSKKKKCVCTLLSLCAALGISLKVGLNIYMLSQTLSCLSDICDHKKRKSKQHNAAVCYMSHLIDTAFKTMAPKQGCLILLHTCCSTPLSPRLPRLRL